VRFQLDKAEPFLHNSTLGERSVITLYHPNQKFAPSSPSKRDRAKEIRVSKRLDALRQESEKVGKDKHLRFVIDGELWELDRWALEGAIRAEHFRAWKLVNKGPIESMS
jgi:hypothetical protein